MKYFTAALILTSACTCINAHAFVYRRVPVENPYYRSYDPYYGYTSRDSVYITGDVGLARLATPEQPIMPIDNVWVSGASYNNESVAAGAAVGFKHAVSRQLLIGAETGYDYNGRSKYTEDYYQNITWTESTNYTISSQDIHLLATGTLLFRSGFNIFAKGGAARVEQKLRVSNDVNYSNLPIFLGETSIAQFKPMAAAGLGFQFRAVDIYGEYSHIFGKDSKNFEDFMDPYGFTNVVSVDTFKIGLGVHVKV